MSGTSIWVLPIMYLLFIFSTRISYSLPMCCFSFCSEIFCCRLIIWFLLAFFVLAGMWSFSFSAGVPSSFEYSNTPSLLNPTVSTNLYSLSKSCCVSPGKPTIRDVLRVTSGISCFIFCD